MPMDSTHTNCAVRKVSVDEIEQQIRDFVVHNYCFNEVHISNDQSFMDSGIIDSTGVLELVSFVELHYAIEVRADELVPENFDSISRLTGFVAKKLGKGTRASVRESVRA